MNTVHTSFRVPQRHTAPPTGLNTYGARHLTDTYYERCGGCSSGKDLKLHAQHSVMTRKREVLS